MITDHFSHRVFRLFPCRSASIEFTRVRATKFLAVTVSSVQWSESIRRSVPGEVTAVLWLRDATKPKANERRYKANDTPNNQDHERLGRYLVPAII